MRTVQGFASVTLAGLLVTMLSGYAGAATAGNAGNVSMSAPGTAAAAKGYYDLQGEPGQTLTLPFVVINPTDQAVEATVYPADGLSADGGGMAVAGPDVLPSGVGAWLKADQHSLLLAPHEERRVEFTLTVPDNVRPGQHVGAVVARVFEAGADPGRPGSDQANLQINQVRQVVIAVMVTVPGPLVHKVTVTGVEHFHQAEQLWLRVKIRNDGTAIERPDGLLRIFDAGQSELHSQSLAMGSLYPGSEGGILVPVDGVITRAGTVTAMVNLTQSGRQFDADRDGGEGVTFLVTLTTQEVSDANRARHEIIKEQRTDDLLILPMRELLIYGGLGLGALLVLGTGLAVRSNILRRRRSRRKPQPETQVLGSRSDRRRGLIALPLWSSENE